VISLGEELIMSTPYDWDESQLISDKTYARIADVPAPALHIHVGHNTPGYLPESDVMCFDSVSDALEALKHELRDQQEHYYELCEGHCPDCAEFEACGDPYECDWCDVATDVEAALSAIADSGPDAAFVSEGRAAWIFRTPEGPDVHHWALSITTDRDACEIAQDQEA
jgi:hypothetical protein